MATKKAGAETPAATERVAPPKPRKFEAPAELDAKFGVLTHTDERVDGIVATADIRELLNEFGLHDRKEIVIPFQHIKRQHGETWAMRIDGLTTHSVHGSAVQGHQWVFMREQPEITGAAQ